MRTSSKFILGMIVESALTELVATAGFLQRQAKRLVKDGESPERAILKLAKMYKLSMHDCELLHFAIAEDAEDVSPVAAEALGYPGDVRGKHPGNKDYMRMYDIIDKSEGNEVKALALAAKMAAAIGRGGGSSSRDKAHRRAKAAREVFAGPLGQKIAQMFMDAA